MVLLHLQLTKSVTSFLTVAGLTWPATTSDQHTALLPGAFIFIALYFQLMKGTMLTMLLEKRKSNVIVEELIHNDSETYHKSLHNWELIIDEFRNKLPELCDPELTRVLSILENTQLGIRAARHSGSHTPVRSYSQWYQSIDKAVLLLRLSSIQLPGIEEYLASYD